MATKSVKAEPEPLESSLGYLIADVRRSLLKVMQAHMTQYKIPASFWPFLRTLWLEDGITQRELGRRAGILDAAAGAVVRDLEGKGYVERVRDDADHRKILVYLTATGRALEAVLFPVITRASDAILDGFSDAEAEDLRQFFLRMRDNLGNAKSSSRQSRGISR